MNKKNTAKLWDNLWKHDISKKEDAFNLAKEENSIRWQRIEKIVLKNLGSFKGLKVIEVGAGAGTNAALMAKRGAEVTILDYSELAIKRSREFFKRNKLKAKFIQQDALNLPKELMSKYDISLSFGLTEHFKDQQRIQINKAHFDLIKKGGITFISVPHKHNLPYRLYKFAAELAGKWNVGEEYPYSRQEFRKICQKIGIKKYAFFGDSLIASFNMINPFRIFAKLLGFKQNLDISKMRPEKGTFLDEYLSYALVLCGFK
ncbi:methyltransferase domain-containing protein [Candidatus Peregrinibacteria bacterium]|jgi:2-polyprenyl-3-methyl-5-hydroxy-6-metoxy-1,4-benzoquinol methylase|nr:methyltransferase domain-containing protein [Candidatus Peregrinibacteria bacterium]